jgi:hypothetical protein
VSGVTNGGEEVMEVIEVSEVMEVRSWEGER